MLKWRNFESNSYRIGDSKIYRPPNPYLSNEKFNMQASSNDLFYSRLPVNEIPLGELLTEEHLFYRVPENWVIVITDIEKSTEAVAAGMHENVNLIATGSMVAILNIAHKARVPVPAFFGGDGATFLIPPSLLPSALNALNKHKENTLQNFGLIMRAGYIPVSTLYSNGHTLSISKWRTSKLFTIPVVLGEGLAYAESLIKSPEYTNSSVTDSIEELDLSGMQCRWDTVEPPLNYDEVVSLLIVARQGVNQAETFKKVIDILDTSYGKQKERSPITASRLRLKGTLRKLTLEMRTKFGKYVPFYLAKSWMTSLIAPYFFKTKKGQTYLNQLVEMSDTLTIDGRINTVISGTTAQREKLFVGLDQLEQQGLIAYGFHVSKESVLSCYVRNLDEGHIHFVDGAGGGYTRAASILKGKF